MVSLFRMVCSVSIHSEAFDLESASFTVIDCYARVLRYVSPGSCFEGPFGVLLCSLLSLHMLLLSRLLRFGFSSGTGAGQEAPIVTDD